MTLADLSNAPDKELRKAWLKERFGSFEYHEELLRLHAEWYALVRKALERSEVSRDYPDLYRFFKETAFKNFDRVAKPGQWLPEFYMAHRAGGSYRAIASYGEIMYPNYWRWMTEDEFQAADAIWRKMSQMCQNIRRTVDQTWDKNDPYTILNERYTGPIEWPVHWQDELPHELAVATQAGVTPERVPAGQAVPTSGWWFTPAKANSRRHFNKGEVLPSIEGSAYGDTYWQWSPEQSLPQL